MHIHHTTACVRIRGLHAVRGQCRILQRIDLEIGSGQMIGLVGDNGSGKSTLLNIIALRNLFGVGGHLEILGEAISDWTSSNTLATLRRRIGQQPQQTPVQNDLTVRDNVDLIAQLRGLSGRDRYHAVREMLDAFGLNHRANDLAGRLNQGGKVLLSLAAGIVGLPRQSLILADEPTAALSNEHAEQLLQTLVRLNKRDGHAMIVSSHDREWLSRLTTDWRELSEGVLQRTHPTPLHVPVDQQTQQNSTRALSAIETKRLWAIATKTETYGREMKAMASRLMNGSATSADDSSPSSAPMNRRVVPFDSVPATRFPIEPTHDAVTDDAIVAIIAGESTMNGSTQSC